MAEDVDKVCFEASYRYLVSKRKSGSISVWKLTGEEANHFWDLNFNSVSDIVTNSQVENQFFVMMSSTDKVDQDQTKADQDSVLLFQFSRPQNLIMYWKFKVPLKSMVFMGSLTFSEQIQLPASLILVNRNGDI
jgi:hypothetical protein